MKRVTAALCILEAAAALALLRCASISYSHGSAAYCAFYCTTAVIFGLGIVHHTVMRDELRAALARLDAASRPSGPHRPALDGVIAVALAAACCETWWTSCGTEHDPDTCTRTDTAA